MNSIKYGVILPGVGIEGVIFGMSKSKVQSIMGKPEEKFRDRFPDGGDYETFDYPSYGLSFNFGSENNYSLNLIRIERSDIQIFDHCISGLNVRKTLDFFKSHSASPDSDSLNYTEENGDEISAYDFSELELSVWFLNDSLNVVQISPFLKDDDTQIFPWKDGVD